MYNGDISHNYMNAIHSMSDLNLFRVLVAVAETGSATEAAERLNLSQSAVSHALRRLRAALDDPLFVKHGRQLVMTPHTRDILPTVRNALSELATTARRERVFDPAESAMTFRCGLRDALEFLIMPTLLQRARAGGWGVRFQSRRVQGEDIEALILSGALDVAMSLEYPVSELLASREVVKEQLAVMVGPQHLAFNQGEISLSDYAKSEHVLVTLTDRERSTVDQEVLGLTGEPRRIALHCEHYHAAAQVVAQTDLLLTMPRTYAERLAHLTGNRLVSLPFTSTAISVRLYWRKSLGGEPYMSWLTKELVDIMILMKREP